MSVCRLLEIGFATKFSLAAMASAFDVSRRIVQRCNLIGAAAYMHCQRMMMTKLMQALEVAKPAFVIVHEM